MSSTTFAIVLGAIIVVALVIALILLRQGLPSKPAKPQDQTIVDLIDSSRKGSDK